MKSVTTNWIAVAGCLVAVGLSACGTTVSKFSYNDELKVNAAVKDENCYDASALLGVDSRSAKDMAKKVVVGLDATIENESDNSINAQRNRHVGVFSGSGGEVLNITLKSIDSKKTFVTVATKTGVIGATGQRPWSCVMIDEIVKLATNK